MKNILMILAVLFSTSAVADWRQEPTIYASYGNFSCGYFNFGSGTIYLFEGRGAAMKKRATFFLDFECTTALDTIKRTKKTVICDPTVAFGPFLEVIWYHRVNFRTGEVLDPETVPSLKQCLAKIRR